MLSMTFPSIACHTDNAGHCGQFGQLQTLLSSEYRMVLGNRPKGKTLNIHQEETYEQKVAKFKETLFLVTNAHLIENENASPFFYYFFLFLEHLSLLWFVLHPGLGIFGDVYLLDQLRVALQILNFQQYLESNSDFYQTIIGVLFAYLLLQLVLIAMSCMTVVNKSTGEFAKYIKKIVNFQLIFNVKVLSGPIMAVAINVLYCQQDSPYRVGSVCYDSVHIAFCALTAIVVIIILAQVLFLGTFYFIKNPLTTSYMGTYSNYYTLSKSLIKVMLPVYFAVDYLESLAIVYIFLVTALWGLFIFWHRMFSVHSYQQEHFYVQYFMESIIFWMAVNNILSYYIEGPDTPQQMSLIYSLFSAVLIAILLMNIEKTAENKFIQQCLEKKVKKQNMERFTFILINRFLQESSKQAKLTFKVYSKIISKNIENYNEIEEKLYEPKDKTEKEEIYHFLCILVESYLEENSSVILKTLKCYLLCYLGQKSYGLHQSLELQEERLGTADEFMLFEFRINQNVFGGERIEKVSIEFVKYYRFHEELGELEELIELCAQNNAEYWDEMCEADPSIAKLRNLATFYDKYYSKITNQYGNVIAVFPQNLYSTNLYLKFLMCIGVDTKEALKVKEKLTTILETRSRSVRVSESQFGEDEDVAIITVNSIGNNLGAVLNCNNNVQQALGFEKNGLLGKNVTKVMPKIYSELHNNFILKFIRSETSHLRPSDKLITALNKDSLLVEMKLTVRMMTSTQSALVIVGFMKKTLKEPEEKESGLLMFSLNTSEILGIDAQFEKLMNYKLSGKQLVQEEVKLASIMPELNLELLEKERCLKTVLEVGNANQQDEMDLEVTKHIRVQLKNTKYYEGVNIGFMTITEDKFREKPLSVAQNEPLQNLTRMITPKLLNLLNLKQKDKGKAPPLLEDVSINVAEGEKLPHVDDGLMQELPMAKKMEEFISNKEDNRIKTFINFIHALTILGCVCIVTFIHLSHKTSLSSMGDMYGEMNHTTVMPYYIGRVNLLTNLIWSVEDMKPQPNSADWLPDFFADFQSLKDTLNSLVVITKQYSANLEYNQLIKYSFKYIKSISGAFVKTNILSTNMNLFNSYIAAAGHFLYANFTQVLQIETMQIQSLFIRYNGDETLPNITHNAVLLFQNYIDSFISGEFQRMVKLKIILLLLSVVTMVLIALIGNYINRINREVVEIYKRIRMWDINELSIKCNGFLGDRGVKINKRRSSSLLRIFPVKTFLEIIANESHKERKSVFLDESRASKAAKKGLSQSFGFRDAMSPDPLMTPALMTPAEHGFLDNEQTLLKGNESEPTVQIFWESNNKWIILGMSILFLILAGVIGVSIISLSANADSLHGKVQTLQQIGEVRKILNFISYFSWRTLENPNDTNVRDLLNKYISEFYQYSGTTYEQLGDPQPVLRNVYTYIETIQQWLSKPNVSSSNILLANYPSIYSGLKHGSDEIEELNQSMFRPEYASTIYADQKNELIFAIVFFLLNVFFILLLDCFYLKPIYRQSKHSVNMIKILPAWVFQRNGEAFDCLAA